MGKLLLCGQPMAAMPYYIENISLNVYSLEELCYYIENNVYLLETDLMNEELTDWIAKELGEHTLSAQLSEIRREGRPLSVFVESLLKTVGYTPKDRMREIVQTLREMDGKSAFACGKVRADRYIQTGRYKNALSVYQALLSSKDADKEDDTMKGSVLHNMGCAYANLFFFAEAADCFEKAYHLTQEPESLQRCLEALRFAHDDSRFYETAQRYGVSGKQQEAILARLAELGRDEAITDFERRMDGGGDNPADGMDGRELLEQWKREYRRNCRI